MALNLYAFVLVFTYLTFSALFAGSYYADVLANTQTSITAPSFSTSSGDMGVWAFLAPVVGFFNFVSAGLTWIYNALANTVLALFLLPFNNGGVVWAIANGIMMIVGVYLIIDIIHGLV